jgi:sortase (surface protein transpeptidase)
VIELETATVKEVYRVERTWIVDPEDVSVLDPTPTRATDAGHLLSLLLHRSCPRRFIVRARAGEASNVL